MERATATLVLTSFFDLAASETDRQKRAAYYFEAQEILVKDVPYLWLYEPISGAAYKSGLQGMYQWSAKSGTYFAQGAWWVGGRNPTNNSSRVYSQRVLYFFSIIGAIFLIVLIAILIKRKGNLSRI